MYKYLQKIANTSIDISDGLVSDMIKLINKQKLSFEININKVPISNMFKLYLNKYYKKKIKYLFNGDDYQVLFTASKKNRKFIKNISRIMNQKITIIGKINNKWPLMGKVMNPLKRSLIKKPLDVGVRVINALLTVGQGQRLGIIAGSGVGKSVLLGMMSKYTEADVVVIALI